VSFLPVVVMLGNDGEIALPGHFRACGAGFQMKRESCVSFEILARAERNTLFTQPAQNPRYTSPNEG
jgi:hypothetical protein